MSSILKSLIQEILSEDEVKQTQKTINGPASASSRSRVTKPASAASTGVQSNVQKFGKSTLIRKTNEVVYDIVIDDLNDLKEFERMFKTSVNIPVARDVVTTSTGLDALTGSPATYAHNLSGWTNDSSVGNSGWVIFGVSKYSPIDDLSSFVSVDMRKAVENYKAYGHAYVLFVDDSGNSIRYEFGPSEKCGDIETDEAFEKIRNDILKNDVLVMKIYNMMLVNRVTFRNFIPIAIAADALPYEMKKKIVSAALMTFLNDMPMNFLPDIIHLLIPGIVWGPRSVPKPEMQPTTPIGKFITPRSMVNHMLDRILPFNGIFSNEKEYVVFKGTSDPTTYLADKSPENIRELRAKLGDTWKIKIYNVKIKNIIFDLNSIFEGDPRTQAIAGVRSTNLKSGTAYCDKILSMNCQIPYAVPFPGIDFPKSSGALNCGTFAANAFNSCSQTAKISLNTQSHELVSPASLFGQIASEADFTKGTPSM